MRPHLGTSARPDGIQEIYDLIDSLAAAGNAVVVVSSELPEIIRLSDRVMVIREVAAAAVLDGTDLSESQILAFAVPAGAGGRQA